MFMPLRKLRLVQWFLSITRLTLKLCHAGAYLHTCMLEVAFPELVCSHTRNINVDCDSDTRRFISPAVFTALLGYLVSAVY